MRSTPLTSEPGRFVRNTIFAALFLISGAVSAGAQDTSFIAFDNFDFSLLSSDPTKSGTAVDELQTIVVLCAVSDGTFAVRASVVYSADASEYYPAIVSAQPPDPCYPPDPIYPPDPVHMIFSKYVRPGDVILLSRDLTLRTVNLGTDFQGNPTFGDWVCLNDIGDAMELGAGTCLLELPGDYFADDVDRLFIGTMSGSVLVVRYDPGLQSYYVENSFGIRAGTAISDLLFIPRTLGWALGVVNEDNIYGIINPEINPTPLFQIVDPDGHDISSAAAWSSQASINFIWAGIIDQDVKVGSVPASVSGTVAINPDWSNPPDDGYPPDPIRQLRLGSIVLLPQNGSDLFYDPTFSETEGFGCIQNITSGSGAGCCCELRGDVDDSGSRDISDLTYFVDFLFAGGASPICIEEGDIDRTGSTDISDLTFFVDYLFGGGDAPPVC